MRVPRNGRFAQYLGLSFSAARARPAHPRGVPAVALAGTPHAPLPAKARPEGRADTSRGRSSRRGRARRAASRLPPRPDPNARHPLTAPRPDPKTTMTCNTKLILCAAVLPAIVARDRGPAAPQEHQDARPRAPRGHDEVIKTMESGKPSATTSQVKKSPRSPW